jgi:hypothetical protein
MPKRSSINNGQAQDVNRVAESGFRLGNSALPEKNPAAVALGRLGGLKGGRARAEKLSPKQRVRIAKKAARARWSNTSG